MTQNSELLARGVGRMFDNEKALLVIFDRKPTDDELRAVHDKLRSVASAPAVGREEIEKILSRYIPQDALGVKRKHCAEELAALNNFLLSQSSAYKAGATDQEIARAVVTSWIESTKGTVQFGFLESELLQNEIAATIANARKAGERVGAEAMREKCRQTAKEYAETNEYYIKDQETTGCMVVAACRAIENAIAALPLPASSETKSDGGVEARHAKTGNTLGSVPGEEMSSSATSFVRATVQEAASQPCAGVATGPSDPIHQSAARESVAEKIIGQIEERFPNWKSFRDLIDCIDCTLYDLRSGYPAPASTDAVRALGQLLEAAKLLRSLISEGGVPRYSVTPGAALNSVIEEAFDPAVAAAIRALKPEVK